VPALEGRVPALEGGVPALEGCVPLVFKRHALRSQSPSQQRAGQSPGAARPAQWPVP
jgi:hypothetical protein